VKNLKTEQWRNNRLGAPGMNNAQSTSRGMLSMADDNKNEVPKEGPGNANVTMGRVLEIAKRVAIVLGLLAAVVVSLPAQGIELPAAVVTIAQALLGILASLGLASSGLKPAAPPAGPRVGPPES
jgi:hypothetical protein